VCWYCARAGGEQFYVPSPSMEPTLLMATCCWRRNTLTVRRGCCRFMSLPEPTLFGGCRARRCRGFPLAGPFAVCETRHRIARRPRPDGQELFITASARGEPTGIGQVERRNRRERAGAALFETLPARSHHFSDGDVAVDLRRSDVPKTACSCGDTATLRGQRGRERRRRRIAADGQSGRPGRPIMGSWDFATRAPVEPGCRAFASRGFSPACLSTAP